jgi:hypothetical protein
MGDEDEVRSEAKPESVEYEPNYWPRNVDFSTNYTNPSNGIAAGFAKQDSLIWYRIKGIPVSKQRNIRQGIPSFQTEGGPGARPEYVFKFLGPLELAETLAHDWAPYESLASSIQTLYGQTGIGALEQLRAWGRSMGMKEADVQQLNVGAIAEAFKSTAGSFGSDPLNQISRLVESGINSEQVVPWRVDTPLVYKNTERRTFELVFNLVSLEGNNYKDVVEPVRLLQAISSPSKVSGNQATYNPKVISPYVFEIMTTPEGGGSKMSYPLLIIPYAVLRSINPVFKGPWMDGEPTRCELRLSFQELEPVYDTTFKNAGRIKPSIK